jgi:hypothetical protein
MVCQNFVNAGKSRMSGNVAASTSRKPKGLYGLYRDNFTFFRSMLYTQTPKSGKDKHTGPKFAGLM